MSVKTKSKYKRPLTLLTASEDERLRASLAEDEGYLGAVRGRNRVSSEDYPDAYLAPSQTGRDLDTGAIESRIRRTRSALEQLSPRNHKFVGAKANIAFARMKVLENLLRGRMLSVKDMGAYPKADNHEKHQNYMLAVEKSIKQEVGNKETQRWAREYKELARRVDPDNPELANIEKFRSKRRY